jgi:hypothetical protein
LNRYEKSDLKGLFTGVAMEWQFMQLLLGWI